MTCERGCNGCDECTDYYEPEPPRRAYRAMEVALMRIAEYPRTRDDEMSIERARTLARATLAYCKSIA